jgi:hypothetical protein
MPTSVTDVRAWLREQGRGAEAGDKDGKRGRGQVKPALIAEYEQAHPPGPPDLELGDEPDAVAGDRPPSDAGAKQEPTGEQPPRRPARGRGRGRLLDRVWTRPTADQTRKKRRQPRADLADFAEETWLDLAWLATPVPPLAEMFTIQAPYAGVVLDQYVKGTPVDSVLQPIARYSASYRALSGLVGAPLFTAMICFEGKVDAKSGEYDLRTQMMFGMLKYSLLQMSKVTDLNADQIQERTEAMTARNAAVDAIIDRLFPRPQPPQAQQGPPPPAPGANGQAAGPGPVMTGPAQVIPGEVIPRGFVYPPPPGMDATGSDPGRESQ